MSRGSARETDIDEVVQTRTVFENVSKGILAKAEHMRKVFGTTDELVICTKVRIRRLTASIPLVRCCGEDNPHRPFKRLERGLKPGRQGSNGLRTDCEKRAHKRHVGVRAQILEEGQVQVSDKERAAQLEQLFRDVVNVLVEKCVNSETMRPYPAAMIDKSLRDLHFNVDVTRSAKVQALEAIAKLQSILPIRRALMRLRVQVRTHASPSRAPSVVRCPLALAPSPQPGGTRRQRTELYRQSIVCALACVASADKPASRPSRASAADDCLTRVVMDVPGRCLPSCTRRC